MSKPALYRKCDHWNDERGEWCEDGELQNAEGRVEDVYGWPVRCPECDGEGYVEFTSAQLAAVAEREALRASLARVAGELSALDQWWDADVARATVADLRGIVDAALASQRPAGREEDDDE